MELSVIAALITLGSVIVSSVLTAFSLKELRRAQKEKEEAGAAAQITDSAIDLMNEMKKKIVRVEEEQEALKAEIGKRDERIEELEGIVEALRDRLKELENGNKCNGGCRDATE